MHGKNTKAQHQKTLHIIPKKTIIKTNTLQAIQNHILITKASRSGRHQSARSRYKTTSRAPTLRSETKLA